MSMREWRAGLSRRLLVAAGASVVLLVNLAWPHAGSTTQASPARPQASAPKPTARLLTAPPVATTSPLARPTVPIGMAPRTGPSATAGAPKAAAQLRQLTLVVAGDVLVHLSIAEQARSDARRTGRGGGYDFFPMFQHVAPRISGADLALCHLEVPLGEPGGPFAGYPLFNAPPQVVDGIRRAGYDGCSVASNHTIDQGVRGVVRTIRALEAAGLGHAGSARSAREATTPRIYERSGIRVAHLSYTMNFNGLRRPLGKEWLANQIEPAKIRAAAKRARAAGAQIVVLSLHWGTEYRHAPNADQQRWASQLITSPDIDLIVGHHAHVVQPFRRYGDKWVVFGMGNHLARQHTAGTQEGVMVRVTFTETASGQWRTSRIEAIPTLVDFVPAIRLIDLPAALGSPSLPAARRQVYQAAYDRVKREVSASGALRSGLVVVRPGR